MRALVWGLGLVLASATTARDLSFEDRVRAEEAIERVRYSYQEGATEPFERAVPRAVLEKKVRTALAESTALAERWRSPITGEALRGEIDRIARHTRFPERLLEIYDALGNDPVLVQETFARGVLADRWARERFEAEASKTGWDAWWAGAESSFASIAVATIASDAPLPAPFAPGASCQAGDTWDNGNMDAVPEGRDTASVVWTGRVMIVWGGYRDGRLLTTGGRYDPVTDTWSPTSTVGAPAARWGPAVAWTGSRMIVWGGAIPGSGDTATGGLYDPVTDTWTPTATIGAPQARHDHTGVWTGSRFLVWGGTHATAYLDDGSSYDPATGTWAPITTVGAPQGRWNHTAIWTGNRMIVWGGAWSNGTTTFTLDTGGRYDPETDTWLPTATAGAPAGRTDHRAAWTGSSMVVWGGQRYPGPSMTEKLGTGGRYDPITDTWMPMTGLYAPTPRTGHVMEAAGSLVMVWGGSGSSGGATDTGARYDTLSDTWTPITLSGAPSLRTYAVAVWTGARLVVWGGAGPYAIATDTGGRYDPALDEWTPTFSAHAPVGREGATSVWTGNEMIVWGGLRGEEPAPGGGRYDPLTDGWRPTSESALNRARVYHTAVWTGSRMIIWGGEPCPHMADKGTSYDPISDTWSALTWTNEPAPRRHHTAVWAEGRMVVWGGLLCTGPPVSTATGSRYNPLTNTWTATSSVGAPSARQDHSGISTGKLLVVWGGVDDNGGVLATGGVYNPANDSWSPTRTQAAPAARRSHTAVWTGTSMIVWGGLGASGDLDTGGRLDLFGDRWHATSNNRAPSPRVGHTAVWAGDAMLVWGGRPSNGTGYDALATGGRYDPVGNDWTPMSVTGAPEARTNHEAVWTGRFMVVWGGAGSSGFYPASGGRYVASNPDADADGVADACDCSPGDPDVSSVPTEVAGLAFAADKATITWS
ncbi:MAG TPA: hypothetical protein VJ826_04910, partial [Candidatus Polarisedimenticolaceae bacterium]|nr:hypothetical protein [Candidatus Polarisedimenticolaceae bacterium]